jgi:dTDP-4-dehydrorhamnose reductase
MPSPLKIILLGVTGQLGSYLSRILINKKYDVYSPRPRSKSLPRIDGLKWLSFSIDASKQVEFEELMDEVKPDFVINCIALTPDSICANNIQTAILVNSVFPHYISNITRQYGAKFIHISTDGVFSGNIGMYTETDVPDPPDLYGRTKLLGEVLDDHCLTIRTSFFGPFNSGHGLIDWLISKKGKEVSGYKNYIFSGISMTTLGRSILSILDKGDLKGLYNLGGPKVSKFQLLEMLSDNLGLDIKVNTVSVPSLDISLDSTKFYKDTKLEFPTLENMMLEIKEEVKAVGYLKI